MGIRVQARVRTPASNGVRCGTIWRYWASRNSEPKTPKYIAAETTLVRVKARTR